MQLFQTCDLWLTPIGIQLAAGYGREDLLLRVASQLEAAQPFVHAATRP